MSSFLNNPGEKWIQAFRALSQSEQTLLSAMLDFDGPTTAKGLRANYDTRVSKREGGHLSFEECITRLDHSFLTVTYSQGGEQLISVQHPSLRDMLLLHLRCDADSRRRYINLASPFGLAGMIGGIAEFSEHEKEPEHSVIPTNEEEFDIFLNRLRSVSQSVLTLREWELLLTAAERLIPRKVEVSDEVTPAVAEFWKLAGSKPPAKRAEPVDLDLDNFACGWKGKIIRAVLEGFSSKRTFENSQRFGADEWIRLLERFYSLTGYLSPPIYPSFTAALCNELPNETDSIRLANLINSVEPLVLKQRATRRVLERWTGEIEAEATHLKSQGEGFEPGDDPYEFDHWHSKSEKFLATARSFATWGTTEPMSAVEELNDVLQSARRPREEEWEEEDQQELPTSGDYWTIDRLFEDL